VLAQNAGVSWADEIGQDAEWLALMRATGATPGGGKRTLIAAAVVAVVLVVALLASSAGQNLMDAFGRWRSGKQQELGVLIVKTIPSGAEVLVDGKKKGKTNLKIASIDANQPHQLVVKPQGKDPIILEIERKDFEKGEDGFPTYVFERDFTPPKDATDAGPAP
jgi:hypothetical protein